MTGQKATPRQMVWRTVKAVAFLAVVLGACVLFSPRTVYITGLWTAAIAATAFPIMYSTLSPWWRYSLGRALFGCISSVALLIDYLLWRLLTHRADEWGIWLGAVLWMWLAVSMVGLINHMIRAQHAGENRNLNGSTE